MVGQKNKQFFQLSQLLSALVAFALSGEPQLLATLAHARWNVTKLRQSDSLSWQIKLGAPETELDSNEHST